MVSVRLHGPGRWCCSGLIATLKQSLFRKFEMVPGIPCPHQHHSSSLPTGPATSPADRTLGRACPHDKCCVNLSGNHGRDSPPPCRRPVGNLRFRGGYVVVTARHLNVNFTSFLKKNCRDGPAYRTRRQVLFLSFVQCCAFLIVSQTHDLICQATSWLCTLAGSVFTTCGQMNFG